MRNSTTGSTRGSADRNRISPCENTRSRCADQPTAGERFLGRAQQRRTRASACRSVRRRRGPRCSAAWRSRQVRLVWTSGLPVSAAISKPATAAWSFRFAPTGRPVAEPDSGSQQDCGRMNRTGADDHLSSSNVLARGCAHAYSTPTIEQHAVDEHVASHVEVRPRSEPARGRRHSSRRAGRRGRSARSGSRPSRRRRDSHRTPGSQAPPSPPAARGPAARARRTRHGTVGSALPCRASHRRRSRHRPRTCRNASSMSGQPQPTQPNSSTHRS